MSQILQKYIKLFLTLDTTGLSTNGIAKAFFDSLLYNQQMEIYKLYKLQAEYTKDGIMRWDDEAVMPFIYNTILYDGKPPIDDVLGDTGFLNW